MKIDKFKIISNTIAEYFIYDTFTIGNQLASFKLSYDLNGPSDGGFATDYILGLLTPTMSEDDIKMVVEAELNTIVEAIVAYREKFKILPENGSWISTYKFMYRIVRKVHHPNGDTFIVLSIIKTTPV